MKETWQVILAGEGGQGLIVGGIILAEAASIYEGKNAAQTVSYGIASRGGFSQAEIIISDREIVYPGVEKPDLVLALTTQAYEKYARSLPPEALLIYDAGLVETGKTETGPPYPYGFHFTDTARELGQAGMANIMALGAMVSLTGLTRADSVEKTIMKRFSGSAAGLNKIIFRRGIEMAEKLKP